MIAIDLSKQNTLDGDPKVIRLINFTGNLYRTEAATMFFFFCWRSKRNRSDFPQGTVIVNKKWFVGDSYFENNFPRKLLLTNTSFKLIETHLVALYVIGNNWSASYHDMYFDSFGVEHIIKEIEKFIGNKKITKNICRIQVYNLIMCRYFFVGFIDVMLNGKSLLDYTNLVSPEEYEKNDKIILKYF